MELLDTIIEALQYLMAGREELGLILNDCEDAYEQIALQFDGKDEQERKCADELKNLKKFYIAGCEKADSLEELDLHIEKVIHRTMLVKKQIESNIEGKVKVVFMPYKYSMWDCMESIWEACRKDEKAECTVLPVPYYDRLEEGGLGEFHYEGESFPMEIRDFQTYQMEVEKPDIVFIHNPYDDSNRVTIVHPYFFSRRIKKYIGFLVYIPYCISGYTYHPERLEGFCQAPGVRYSDIVVVQSESLKQVYMEHGIEEDKIMVLGSPKVDAIINKCKDRSIVEKWEKKRDKRKCILLNSSISTFLKSKNGIGNISGIINEITAQHKVFLIWRPHPLLKATIASMRQSQMQEYDSLMERIAASDDIEMDLSEDALTAINYSDGLISDYSSLILQYLFTEKPVLALTGKSVAKNRVVFCDYFASYFKEDGISVEDFIEIILTGNDWKKEERILRAKESMANTDGDCGRKVFEAVKEKYLKEVNI